MVRYQVNASDYSGAIVIERDCGEGWHVPAWYEMDADYAEFAGCNGDCTCATLAAAEAALARFMTR